MGLRERMNRCTFSQFVLGGLAILKRLIQGACLFIIFSTLKHQHPMALAIERYSPQGELDGSAREISISFTEELVDLSSDDTKHMKLIESYIKITPMPAGKFVWQNARTVHFKPESPFLPFATNYIVTIMTGIVSRMGKILSHPLTFAFSTSPPKIVNSWPNRVSDSLSPIVFIAFDQRINSVDILPKIRVECGQATFSRSKFILLYEDDIYQHEALKLLSHQHPPGHYVAFKLREELPRDTAVMVVLDQGTPSAEGPKTTPVPQVFQFSTYAVEAERFFRNCAFSTSQLIVFKCTDSCASMYSRACVMLGDVDNDRESELVVGTATGELVVFKHTSTYRSASQLQCICAIAIADVLNNKKNQLLALSPEGTCYIFEVNADHHPTSSYPAPLATPQSSAPIPLSTGAALPASQTAPLPPHGPLTTSGSLPSVLASGPQLASSGGASTAAARFQNATQMGGQSISNLQSLLQSAAQAPHATPLSTPIILSIPYNASAVLVADIDGDGQNELIIGRSDRSVESFSVIQSITAGNRTAVSIVRKNSWHVSGEVSALAALYDESGKCCLLIGQALGRFLVVNQDGILLPPSFEYNVPTVSPSNSNSSLSNVNASSSSSVVSVASLTSSASPAWDGLPTELCAPFCSNGRNGGPNNAPNCGVLSACMNGTLRLHSLQSSQPVWEMDLPSAIFAPHIFRLRGAREDCVGVCSPDGLTYLIDHERNMLQYKFPENVVAFAAGSYSVISGQPAQTCLVYVTSDNKVHILYHLRLEELFAPDEPLGPFKREIADALGLVTNPLVARDMSKEWSRADAPLLLESCLRNDFASPYWQARKSVLQAHVTEKRD